MLCILLYAYANAYVNAPGFKIKYIEDGFLPRK